MKQSWLFILFCFLFLAVISAPVSVRADAEPGAKVYKKRCAVCHATQAGKHKNGPSLAAIFGRQAGSSDFTKYKGLKGSSVVWDAENLDKFLTNPKKFVGGKTMTFKLRKEKERVAVIEFLKTLK